MLSGADAGPAGLLWAERAIVEFTGREAQLAELRGWYESYGSHRAVHTEPYCRDYTYMATRGLPGYRVASLQELAIRSAQAAVDRASKSAGISVAAASPHSARITAR